MKKRVTAAELMNRLNADPDYLARKAIQDEAMAMRVGDHAREEAPLVEALHAAGAQVSSVWQLVNSKARYTELLPMLISHLDRPYPMGVRQGIARALAVRESRPFWHKLVQHYVAETDNHTNGVKWALHIAIAVAADITVLDTLMHLAVDRRHGGNRVLFVDSLARMKDMRVTATLAELESDPDLADDVLRVLKRKRSRP